MVPGILYALLLLLLSHFSQVQLCVMLWTVACQAPLSMVFSRQEYWNGLLFPTLWDLPDPIQVFCTAGGFCTIWAHWRTPPPPKKKKSWVSINLLELVNIIYFKTAKMYCGCKGSSLQNYALQTTRIAYNFPLCKITIFFYLIYRLYTTVTDGCICIMHADQIPLYLL